MIKAGFSLGVGSVLNISYGSDTNESNTPIPNPPQFAYSCDFRVSPDPSMPLMMPLNVTNTANTYYFFANTTSTVTQFTANTYFSVTPVDDMYLFNKNIPLTAYTSTIVPFYGNVPSSGQYNAPQNITVTLGSDSSLTFGSTGIWLLSGVVYLQQPASGPGNYVSNVHIWHTPTNSSGSPATIDYSYATLSTQGRDPTIAFSMPIKVTSTSQKYYTNIYSNATTSIIGSNSYYIATQISSGSYTGYETVLSNNGLLLTPTNQSQNLS
jgi:hypothetical protein